MRKANLGYSFRWHIGKRLMAAISLSAVLSAGASARLALAAVLLQVVASTPSAQAQVGPTFNLLYSFTNITTGEFPYAGVVRDAAGNLYGTTYYGGDTQCLHFGGCGTVFKVDTTGKETVLHSFTGSADGKFPEGGVLRDAASNLYGTTIVGGTSDAGTVFKLDTTGKETVLHSFTGGGADGQCPAAGLVRDGAGNLYGTTANGGRSGKGTVFKVDTTGKETVLHSFAGTGGDGANPYAGLVRDTAGNLYGTTFLGGASCNCGTVFKLDTTGKETVLLSFTGLDGEYTTAGLVQDSAGNLYGTTAGGGTSGYGVVFKLDKTGTETVLHSFTGGTTDGNSPYAGLVRDAAGNLYGTTHSGGASNDGTVFKLTPD
jgi:uncharacterized repeat protein (TIGR03803 family)